MEFFRIHRTIPFMHYRHVLNAISFVSFIVAVYWIFTHGLTIHLHRKIGHAVHQFTPFCFRDRRG
jgi:preprotein translocase subunit SecF